MKKGLRGAELESVEGRIDEVERKVDRLRTLYESFFMGVERTPPNTLRREANRQVLELQQVPIGNATVRFRFQSVVQRWVMMTSYWNRTMREIEAGTYQRDVARAQRHLASRGGSLTESDALAMGIPANRVKAFMGRQQKLAAARGDGGSHAKGEAPNAGPPPTGASPVSPASPPPASAASRSPAPASDIPGLGPGDLEAFYTRFVDAHVQAVGAPPRATLEEMGAKLRRELPKLVGSEGGRVVLDVVVDGGKVRLKARPAKE